MIRFFDQTPQTLAAWCERHGLPRFAAGQIMEWVYRHGVTEPRRMTNLSKKARALLAAPGSGAAGSSPARTAPPQSPPEGGMVVEPAQTDGIVFEEGVELAHQVASDGTQKMLLGWPPDQTKQTECVMIPTEKRRTACISSQVGCPVGCRFCASGLGGLDGNLTAARIVEQVYRLGRLPETGRVTNVVFMGMGEPLANYKAVTDAIRTINASWGLGISARKITVSTVGLPAAIRRLATFEIPVTLALSLHAPNDEVRRSLIPWAEYATIDELLDACDEYFQKSGREITLEYLLIRNVNDRREHAHELAGVAKRLRANVNLIRYNEVKGLPYDRPTTSDVRAFQEILRERGVNNHLRASRGRDIAAACGQLRHERRQDSPAAGAPAPARLRIGGAAID